MSRKLGDKGYDSYMNYQAFSSDMPVQQINQTQWYLKFEKGLPGFYLKTDDVFQQMPTSTFIVTATRSTIYDFSGWQQQMENYFNLTKEEILCQTNTERVKSLPSTEPLELTSNT